MNSKQRDIWGSLVGQCEGHAYSRINVASKVRSETILAMNVAYREMELAAHIHDKACGELAQTVYTERQLRLEAERRAVIAEARVDHLSQSLNAEVELRQEAEQETGRYKIELPAARAEAKAAQCLLDNARVGIARAKQRADCAESKLAGAGRALDECDVKPDLLNGDPAGVIARIFRLNRRADRNETLAALVTIKVAELLERLANHTAAHTDSLAAPDSPWALLRRAEIESARTLAAKIREALNDDQA